MTRKQPFLHYPTALERGWPIATGVIEGAYRHLVRDPMDITGARWGLDGAEAVLKLRAIVARGALALSTSHASTSASIVPASPAPALATSDLPLDRLS